jgi:hypothetical protein
MDISSLFQQLGIALGLGLLVGLQRESAASPLAGVRKFPLVTVLGTVCELLSQSFGGWILAAGIIALVVIIYRGTWPCCKSRSPRPTSQRRSRAASRKPVTTTS